MMSSDKSDQEELRAIVAELKAELQKILANLKGGEQSE